MSQLKITTDISTSRIITINTNKALRKELKDTIIFIDGISKIIDHDRYQISLSVGELFDLEKVLILVKHAIEEYYKPRQKYESNSEW